MLRLSTEDGIFRGAEAVFAPLRLEFCAGFRVVALLIGRDPSLPRLMTVASDTDEGITLAVDTDDLLIRIALPGSVTEQMPVGRIYCELWLFHAELKRVAAVGFPIVHDTLLA